MNENTNLYQHLQMFHATGFNAGPAVQRSMPLPRQDVFSEEEYSSVDDEDMEEMNSEDDGLEESYEEEEDGNVNNNLIFAQNRRLSMSGMLESPIQIRSVPIGIQQVTRSNSQPNSQPRRMSIVNSPPLSFGLMGRPEYAGMFTTLNSACAALRGSTEILQWTIHHFNLLRHIVMLLP